MGLSLLDKVVRLQQLRVGPLEHKGFQACASGPGAALPVSADSLRGSERAAVLDAPLASLRLEYSRSKYS